ncbi:MAG: hypothetical protein ACYC2U_00060 [Candidatus Amoebophilus sp.]
MLNRFKISKLAFSYLSAFLLMLVASSLNAEPSIEQLSQQHTYQPFIKEKAFVRRAKGMNGVGIFGGTASIGPIGGLEWSYQAFLSSHLKVLGGIERKKQPYITYRSLFLQPMLYHTVFTNYHNFCVNMGEGLIFTHIRRYDEKLEHAGRSDDEQYNKDKSNLNVGVVLGGEIELYVFKTFEITLSGGPIIYIFKDPYDRISYYINLGLKFNF